VNVTKNMIEKATEMETNAAGEPVGAESKRVGALPGKTERSYCGETSGMVQLMGAELLLREQEPNMPMKTLGPSVDCIVRVCRAVDGVTARRATWSCSNKFGASNAKRVKKIVVRASNGAR